MAETTQSPPAETTRPAASNKPLPSTEEDFHTKPSRTQSSASRGVGIGVVVLLIVGFFVYRYASSYQSTDDAQVDGHINSISARVAGRHQKLNVEDEINTCRRGRCW